MIQVGIRPQYLLLNPLGLPGISFQEVFCSSKKKKPNNKKTTTKQNQEQESTSENRSGPHVVFSSTDTHTHTSCLGYISFKNSLWKKIQAIGATSAFSKVDWDTELSLYLRVWFEVPTCIKLILLLWALNGISANSPEYLTEMSREM